MALVRTSHDDHPQLSGYRDYGNNLGPDHNDLVGALPSQEARRHYPGVVMCRSSTRWRRTYTADHWIRWGCHGRLASLANRDSIERTTRMNTLGISGASGLFWSNDQIRGLRGLSSSSTLAQ